MKSNTLVQTVISNLISYFKEKTVSDSSIEIKKENTVSNINLRVLDYRSNLTFSYPVNIYTSF